MITPLKLPFLTDTPGIGGTIKNTVDDFCVDEKLKYPCSGHGDFLYVEIEKQNLTTFELIRRLCKSLQINKNDVGYAGIKDSYATTKQFFSLFKVKEADLVKINIPGTKICNVLQHHKKLKLGNISENYFSIVIKNSTNQISVVKQTLQILQKKGVPNYYGQQRFGKHFNTHLLGKYLLLNDYNTYTECLFSLSELDTPVVTRFKSLFHEQKYSEAFDATPASFDTEKGILSFLAKGKNLDIACKRGVSRKKQYFYLCAYQSYLFNLCLSQRLRAIDTMFNGDLAMLHPTHSVFLVEDAAVEQNRCDMHKISPTGPLIGYKMIEPKGKQWDIEKNILQQEFVDPQLFQQFKMPGERRSLRFFVKDVEVSPHEENIKLQFALSTGCYATTVLREIMKTDSLSSDD